MRTTLLELPQKRALQKQRRDCADLNRGRNAPNVESYQARLQPHYDQENKSPFLKLLSPSEEIKGLELKLAKQQPPKYADHDNYHQYLHRFSVMRDPAPFLTKEKAKRHKCCIPQKRSCEGIDCEFHLVHAAHACRNADEVAHHRDQAAEEDRLLAIAVKPSLSPDHVCFVQQRILPVSSDEPLAAIPADLVCDKAS